MVETEESDATNSDKCPCKKGYKTLMLPCKKCKTYWHASCVKLSGLKKADLNRLTDWHCPYCYKLPEAAVKECTLQSLDKKISDMKTNFDLKFTTTIEEVQKKSDDQAKKWTDFFSKEKDQDQIQQVMTTVIEKSKQKMDSDHVEREKRKQNVVLRDLKESEEATNEKIREDHLKIATRILNIEESDIEVVFRAGKRPQPGDPPPETPRGPRPLIVRLKTPQTACALHGHGRGRKFNHPDMCSLGKP